MRDRSPITLAVILGFLACGAATAEDGVMVLHVTYLDKKPLAKVRIGPTGDGSIEETDVGGRARIRLAAGVKVEQELTLQVVPGEKEPTAWVFISPWDQRVRVPPFESGQAVQVVLAKKADKDALLGSSEGRLAIEQAILSKLSQLQQAKTEVSPEQRRAVLEAQATAFGLNPEEVDEAIRSASQKSPDLYEQGLAALYEKNYPLATERLEKALAASERKLAQDHIEVGDRAFFLGQSLYEEGRYKESVTSFKRAAELRGENVATLNYLGIALDSSGVYDEAEAVLNRALLLSHGMNNLLSIQSNLAVVLLDRGDLKGARRLAEQVLENRRQVSGTRNRDTLNAMSNLALIVKAQGDVQRARQLREQVVEALRQLLGPEHRDTLIAMDNLGVTLQDQGDLQRALRLQEKVVEALRRVLGPEHPDTLIAMDNFSSTLYLQGDLSKARKIQEQVLDATRRLLGAEHPRTLTAMSNLASTLAHQGDLPKARQLEEQVLEARRRLLGYKHSATTLAEWNLLRTEKKLCDAAGAQKLEQDLNWLLHTTPGNLSAQQREIRQKLAELQEIEMEEVSRLFGKLPAPSPKPPTPEPPHPPL